MKQHYVEFLSPGTFVHETTRREVAKWDVEAAVEMARGIRERHAATPFGFRFITRERGPNDLDASETARGPMHYLGGEVLTVEDVEARNDPADKILISNMRGNGWERIIVNTNSWKVTQPLMDDDVVLDFEPAATA